MPIPATPEFPRDPDQEQVVPAEPLRQLLIDMFVRRDAIEEEAAIAAARLIEADLRGIHSHGSRSVGRYLRGLATREIDPRAEIKVERETAAMAVLDGGMGLGHVASTKAMQMAIAKAGEVGTGTVAVRRSQHYGAASVYALLAVDAGMIGYSTTSTAWATVAAYGSRAAGVANNAFAWGVPTREGAPFVLDTACAVSSWGKVNMLGLYGLPVPEGWALDKAGNPTTDPAAVETLLPAAGARGYGLAFLSSVLAGTLVGGRMPLHKSREVEKDGSEHFFYAIDIKHFVDPEAHYEELQATIEDIRRLPPAEGFDKVRLPGELEWEREQKWREQGIPFHRDDVRKLAQLAAELGLDTPW